MTGTRNTRYELCNWYFQQCTPRTEAIPSLSQGDGWDERRDADSDEVCNAAATPPEWTAVQLYWGVTRFEFRQSYRLFQVNFPCLPRTFETNCRKKYTDVDPVCVWRHSSTSSFLYSLTSLWSLNNVGNEPGNKSEPHSGVSRGSAHSLCPLKVPMQYETNLREDLTESWRLPFAKPQSPSPLPSQRYRLLSCPLFTWTRWQVITETLQLFNLRGRAVFRMSANF